MHCIQVFKAGSPLDNFYQFFTNETFSLTNEVIKELLSNTNDIEVVVIDDE